MNSEIVGEDAITLTALLQVMEQWKSYSSLLNKWQEFGEHLEVSRVRLLNLRKKLKKEEEDLTEENVLREILRLWKHEQGENATLGVLGEALKECGLKDLSDFILIKLWKRELAIQYLTNYWIKEHNARKGYILKDFARKCLKAMEETMTNDEIELSGMYEDEDDHVPLMHLLLAEVYARDAKTASNQPTVEENSVIPISFFEMFMLFMKMRFARVKIRDQNSKRICWKVHVRWAIKLIFPEWVSAFQENLSVSERIDENIISSVGIFQRDLHTNTGKFISRRFAEYLLADLIVENLGKHGEFVDLLFGEILGRKGTTEEKSDYGYSAYSLKHPKLMYFIEKHLEHYFEDSKENYREIMRTLILQDYQDRDHKYYKSTKFNYEDLCVALSACCTNDLERTFNFVKEVLYHHETGIVITKEKMKYLLLAAVERSQGMMIAASSFLYCYKKDLCDPSLYTEQIIRIRNCDWNLVVPNFTPIHMAAKFGKYNFLAWLIRDYDEDELKKFQYLLHVCVNGSHFDSDDVIQEKELIIELLVMKNPACLEEKEVDDDLATPLLLPNAHLKLLKLLVKLGADINATGNGGETLLHIIAGKSTYMERVTWALENGFRHINSEYSVCRTSPLMDAISTLGTLDDKNLKVFHDAGADFNAKNKYGVSPILLCAIKYSNDVDFIGRVVDYGADVNYINQYGNNAAHAVINIKDTTKEIIPILNLLEAKGFEGFKHKNNDGRTPLDLARQYGKADAELIRYFQARTMSD